MIQKPILLLVLCLICGVNLYANDEATYQINIQNVPHGGTHSEYYAPADMPEVYINSQDLEIIIVANGVALYYDVEIISQKTNHSVLYTKISGYGDIIDVSYLPEAYYRIVIHSSNNNVFEGYFKKTESSSLKNPFYHRRK
jgi:hypothetical protein